MNVSQLWIGSLVLLTLTTAVSAEPAPTISDHIPKSTAELTVSNLEALQQQADKTEAWCVQRAAQFGKQSVTEVLAGLDSILAAKRDVDTALEAVLKLRRDMHEFGEEETERARIRLFLQTTSLLVDLSGRLRYGQGDAVGNAIQRTRQADPTSERLIVLLAKYRCTVGAHALAELITSPQGRLTASEPIKRQVIQLCRVCADPDLIGDLAYIVENETSLQLALDATEAIEAIGIPQDVKDTAGDYQPPTTAADLHRRLNTLSQSASSKTIQQRCQQVLARLSTRMTKGIRSDEFRYGELRLRAGDWMLLRNPSPYNQFTDIAPGLFTHVGVVTTIEENGKRRFVIADLPERGDRVPATNVDEYLSQTLHYVFLRHQDEDVAKEIGQAAHDMIGNETQFDLLFEIKRVEELKGKPLRGQRIHTYCAGFLLICAQATGRPDEEFFPVPERSPPGYCQENLKTLGLSIGDNYVSPTGPLFSTQMSIVGGRSPMYQPERAVKEAVYDHFGLSMVQRKLTPAPDLFQALRQKLAELSKYNPWLARALAKSNNVSEHLDLESAAKAAAVIETLDRIANTNARQYTAARQAIMAGSLERLKQRGIAQRYLDNIAAYRRIHAQLYASWTARELTARDLRIRLVAYYKRQGRQQLDSRFFHKEVKSPTPSNRN